MKTPEEEELDRLDRGWLKIHTMDGILKERLLHFCDKIRYGVGFNDEYHMNQLKSILELKNRMQKEEDQLVVDAITRTSNEKHTGD